MSAVPAIPVVQTLDGLRWLLQLTGVLLKAFSLRF